MKAIMFGGQGSQKIGMGKTFFDKYDYVREIYEKASEVCGFDVPKMCFEENDKLNSTRYAQPCLYTTNYAMGMVLEKEYNTFADYYLGLSLGEYNAFLEAAAFSFEDGLKLIKRRGEIMEEAFLDGNYGMAAVLNLEYSELLSRVKAEEGELYIANNNTKGQIVVSGSMDMIDSFIEKLKADKIKAIKLNVSGAFHSPLLNNASSKLALEFDNITLNTVNKKVVSNLTGKIETNVKETLVKQLTNEVKFCDSIEFLINEGVDTFIEVGVGKTLSGFVKKINKDVTILNIEEMEANG
ncbi:MAG: ACP S-malonyltransferase [Lachnospirales bacterium]